MAGVLDRYAQVEAYDPQEAEELRQGWANMKEPTGIFTQWQQQQNDYSDEAAQAETDSAAPLRGFASGVAGVIKGQAELGNLFGLGDGTLAKATEDIIQKNNRKKVYDLADMIPFASDYYTNPEGALYDISSTTGSALTLGAEMAGVTTGIGALGGALGLGGTTAAGLGVAGRAASTGGQAVKFLTSRLGSGMRRLGCNKLASVLEGPFGQLYALNILKTPLEAASEAGNQGADALAQGKSIDEARKEAAITGLIQMPLLALSNSLESANLGGLFAKEASKALGRKVTAKEIPSIIGSVTKEALQNAWEEGMQQSTGEYAAGEQSITGIVNPFEWSDEAKLQAAVGGVTGAAIGGGNAGLQAVVGRGKRTAAREAENIREQGDRGAIQEPYNENGATGGNNMAQNDQDIDIDEVELNDIKMGMDDIGEKYKQYLETVWRDSNTPKDAKDEIAKVLNSNDDALIASTAQKYGWAGATETEQPQVNPAMTSREQQQAATNAVNNAVKAINNQAPNENGRQPASPRNTGKYTSLGGKWLRRVKSSLPKKLEKFKRDNLLDSLGGINKESLRKNLGLKEFLSGNQGEIQENLNKALYSNDRNAMQKIENYSAPQQAAILDALDNGWEHYYLTEDDARALTNSEIKALRSQLWRESNKLGEKRQNRVRNILKTGTDKQIVNLARKFNLPISNRLETATNKTPMIEREQPIYLAGREIYPQEKGNAWMLYINAEKNPLSATEEADLQSSGFKRSKKNPYIWHSEDKPRANDFFERHSAPAHKSENEKGEISNGNNTQKEQENNRVLENRESEDSIRRRSGEERTQNEQQDQRNENESKKEELAPAENGRATEPTTAAEPKTVTEAEPGETKAKSEAAAPTGEKFPTVRFADREFTPEMAGNKIKISLPKGRSFEKAESREIKDAGYIYSNKDRAHYATDSAKAREFINKYALEPAKEAEKAVETSAPKDNAVEAPAPKKAAEVPAPKEEATAKTKGQKVEEAKPGKEYIDESKLKKKDEAQKKEKVVPKRIRDKIEDLRANFADNKEQEEFYLGVANGLARSSNLNVRDSAPYNAAWLAHQGARVVDLHHQVGDTDFSFKDYADGIKVVVHDDDGNASTVTLKKVLYQEAYHGSPANFDRFDLTKIGSGVGDQVHGWGLYFAKDEDVAAKYFNRYPYKSIYEREWNIFSNPAVDSFRLNAEVVGELLDKMKATPYLGDISIDELMESYPIKRITIDVANRAVEDAKERIKELEELLQEHIKKNHPFSDYLHWHKPVTAHELKQEILDHQKELYFFLKAVGGEDAVRNRRIRKLILKPNVTGLYEAVKTHILESKQMYKVEIPNDDVLLIESKRYDNQPKRVQKAMVNLVSDFEGVASQEDAVNMLRAINGAQFWHWLADNLGSGEAASRTLNAYGIKGIKYYGTRDGDCRVIFDDEAIEILEKYYEIVNKKIAGEFATTSDGADMISLFKNANKSTFIHESAHKFYKDISGIARIAKEKFGEEHPLYQDWKTVDDWAQYKDGQEEEYKGTAVEEEFAARAKAIKEAEANKETEKAEVLKSIWAQERIARGIEEGLKSGTIKNSKLQKVLNVFKTWLRKVYSLFAPSVELAPEVAKAINRLLGDTDYNAIKAKAEAVKAEKTATSAEPVAKKEIQAAEKPEIKAKPEPKSEAVSGGEFPAVRFAGREVTPKKVDGKIVFDVSSKPSSTQHKKFLAEGFKYDAKNKRYYADDTPKTREFLKDHPAQGTGEETLQPFKIKIKRGDKEIWQKITPRITADKKKVRLDVDVYEFYTDEQKAQLKAAGFDYTVAYSDKQKAYVAPYDDKAKAFLEKPFSEEVQITPKASEETKKLKPGEEKLTPFKVSIGTKRGTITQTLTPIVAADKSTVRLIPNFFLAYTKEQKAQFTAAGFIYDKEVGVYTAPYDDKAKAFLANSFGEEAKQATKPTKKAEKAAGAPAPKKEAANAPAPEEVMEPPAPEQEPIYGEDYYNSLADEINLTDPNVAEEETTEGEDLIATLENLSFGEKSVLAQIVDLDKTSKKGEEAKSASQPTSKLDKDFGIDLTKLPKKGEENQEGRGLSLLASRQIEYTNEENGFVLRFPKTVKNIHQEEVDALKAYGFKDKGNGTFVTKERKDGIKLLNAITEQRKLHTQFPTRDEEKLKKNQEGVGVALLATRHFSCVSNADGYTLTFPPSMKGITRSEFDVLKEAGFNHKEGTPVFTADHAEGAPLLILINEQRKLPAPLFKVDAEFNKEKVRQTVRPLLIDGGKRVKLIVNKSGYYNSQQQAQLKAAGFKYYTTLEAWVAPYNDEAKAFLAKPFGQEVKIVPKTKVLGYYNRSSVRLGDGYLMVDPPPGGFTNAGLQNLINWGFKATPERSYMSVNGSSAISKAIDRLGLDKPENSAKATPQKQSLSQEGFLFGRRIEIKGARDPQSGAYKLWFEMPKVVNATTEEIKGLREAGFKFYRDKNIWGAIIADNNSKAKAVAFLKSIKNEEAPLSTESQKAEDNTKQSNPIPRNKEVGKELVEKALTPDDQDFPQRLKGRADSPKKLYIKGDPSCLNKKCIAIIGTREPSPEAVANGEGAGAWAADSGYVVVSGLAAGCDTAAHKGCLDAGGQTIAFLGTGLDRVYPKENVNLSEAIANGGGCLVTEYEKGSKGNFLERDRLQADISSGVIVVEAGINRGTMYAVRRAWARGIPVGAFQYDDDHYTKVKQSLANERYLREKRFIPITDRKSFDDFLKIVEKYDKSRGSQHIESGDVSPLHQSSSQETNRETFDPWEKHYGKYLDILWKNDKERINWRPNQIHIYKPKGGFTADEQNELEGLGFRPKKNNNGTEYYLYTYRYKRFDDFPDLKSDAEKVVRFVLGKVDEAREAKRSEGIPLKTHDAMAPAEIEKVQEENRNQILQNLEIAQKQRASGKITGEQEVELIDNVIKFLDESIKSDSIYHWYDNAPGLRDQANALKRNIIQKDDEARAQAINKIHPEIEDVLEKNQQGGMEYLDAIRRIWDLEKEVKEELLDKGVEPSSTVSTFFQDCLKQLQRPHIERAISEAGALTLGAEGGLAARNYYVEQLSRPKYDLKTLWNIKGSNILSPETIEAAATLLAFRAQSWSSLFNEVYGTEYSPLKFAERWTFSFENPEHARTLGDMDTESTITDTIVVNSKTGKREKKRIEVGFAKRHSTYAYKNGMINESALSGELFHEIGHVLFTDLATISDAPDAPEQLKTDFKTVKEWLVKEWGKYKTGEDKYNFTKKDKQDLEKPFTVITDKKYIHPTWYNEGLDERFAQAFAKYALERNDTPIPRVNTLLQGLKRKIKAFVNRVATFIERIFADSTLKEEVKQKRRFYYDVNFSIPEEIYSVMDRLIQYGDLNRSNNFATKVNILRNDLEVKIDDVFKTINPTADKVADIYHDIDALTQGAGNYTVRQNEILSSLRTMLYAKIKWLSARNENLKSKNSNKRISTFVGEFGNSKMAANLHNLLFNGVRNEDTVVGNMQELLQDQAGLEGYNYIEQTMGIKSTDLEEDYYSALVAPQLEEAIISDFREKEDLGVKYYETMLKPAEGLEEDIKNLDQWLSSKKTSLTKVGYLSEVKKRAQKIIADEENYPGMKNLDQYAHNVIAILKEAKNFYLEYEEPYRFAMRRADRFIDEELKHGEGFEKLSSLARNKMAIITSTDDRKKFSAIVEAVERGEALSKGIFAEYDESSNNGEQTDGASRTYVNERHKGEVYQNVEQKMNATIHKTNRDNLVEKASDWVKTQKEQFYRNWVDKYTDLGIFDRAIAEASNNAIPEHESILNKAQLASNHASGMVEALLTGTTEHLKQVKNRYNISHLVSLKDIIDPLVNNKDKYIEYVRSSNADGRTDAQACIDAFDNYLTARSLFESIQNHKLDYNRDLAEWINNGKHGKKPEFEEYKLPGELTEQEIKETLRNAPSEFKSYARLFKQYTDNLLDILKNSGLITEKHYDNLKLRYKAYCPLMRDFSDTADVDNFINQINAGKGIVNVSDPLKSRRSEGSKRDIISPLETIIKSTDALVTRAERNSVGQELVKRAAKYKLTDFVQEVKGETGDAKNCIFTVFINGEKHAYRTIPELYAPITAGFKPGLQVSWALLTKPAQLLRAGSTMSPSFIIRNFLRDTIWATITSKNGFKPIYDSVRGAYALWRNSQLRAEFDAAGVISSNFYADSDAVRTSLDKLAGGEFEIHSPMDLIKAIGKYPIEFLRYFSDNVEASTRAGEFLRAREKGKSVDEALYHAVELTLNFGRSGVEGQQFNRIVPFFNACLQGGDKLYRLCKENFKGTMMRIGTWIIMPSLFLWALNHDEDWYKELDPHIKATNWLLPNGIRIPKPQEAGVLFGSGVEAMMDAAYNQDKQAVDNWSKAWLDTMLPGVIPTLILPIIEWQANYSFFRGKPVVNSRLLKLPEEMQYESYTSEASKFIGKQTGLSPAKIDNAWRSVTGTMGMFVLQTPDLFAAEKQNLPAKKMTEMPVFRDFLVNDMNLTRTMNDFYELKDVATKQHNAYGKKGSPSVAVKAVNTASNSISKLRMEIRDITNNQSLNPTRKRQKIDKLQQQQKRIARACLNKYARFFEA